MGRIRREGADGIRALGAEAIFAYDLSWWSRRKGRISSNINNHSSLVGLL